MFFLLAEERDCRLAHRTAAGLVIVFVRRFFLAIGFFGVVYRLGIAVAERAFHLPVVRVFLNLRLVEDVTFVIAFVHHCLVPF